MTGITDKQTEVENNERSPGFLAQARNLAVVFFHTRLDRLCSPALPEAGTWGVCMSHGDQGHTLLGSCPSPRCLPPPPLFILDFASARLAAACPLAFHLFSNFHL